MSDTAIRIDDIYDEPIVIEAPASFGQAIGGVVSISVWEDGGMNTWIGDRAQLRKLIEALQEFESKLEPKKNDASNLPPMSNKVEGGGHFGLG